MDLIYIALAIVFATISAICNTVLSLTFGEVTGVIVDYVFIATNPISNSTSTVIELATEDLMKGLRWFVLTTCLMGVATLICTYLATLLFNYSALQQVQFGINIKPLSIIFIYF